MNNLYRIGVSVSYDRVLEIESSIATAVCKRFEEENLVCLSNLQHGLVTVGALDNIDYNPSSATAQSSFHGTGFNIFQLPNHGNCCIVRNLIIIEGASLKKLSLPGEYVNVPAVSCKTDQLSVQQLAFSVEGAGVLDAGKAGGNGFEHCMHLLTKDKLMNEDYISWAAFHASLELNPPNPPAIIALLQLFCFTFISSQYLDHLPQKPAKHSRSKRIWLDTAN